VNYDKNCIFSLPGTRIAGEGFVLGGVVF